MLALCLALGVTTAGAQGGPGGDGQHAATAKKKKQKRGPRGPRGPAGPQGPPGPAGPSTGQAGGALAGSYPSPTLNVSGGPCANGQAVTGISSLAAITCAPSLFVNGAFNVAATPTGLPALTTGQGNTGLGWDALVANTSAFGNTAVGFTALDSTTTGFANTAVGVDSLDANVDGVNNTALGNAALFSNTAGDHNIAIGAGAGTNLTTGSENVAIANGGVAGESNTIRIGDGDNTRAFISGIRGTATGVDDAVGVVIDSAGQLGTVSSSRRFKTDIEPLGADAVMGLKPVSFRYREGPGELHYGLIAEQVEKVLPTLVAYDQDGLPETVQYQELPALLLAEIQDQRRQIDRQQDQIRWLMRQVKGG